jgi:hypothetical protein
MAYKTARPGAPIDTSFFLLSKTLGFGSLTSHLKPTCLLLYFTSKKIDAGFALGFCLDASVHCTCVVLRCQNTVSEGSDSCAAQRLLGAEIIF